MEGVLTMNEIKLCICPVCHKAFASQVTRGRKQQIVCSAKCRIEMAKVKREGGIKAIKKMQEEAESLRCPPRKDCKAYDPVSGDCAGLTGLWCTVEKCKFYSKKVLTSDDACSIM